MSLLLWLPLNDGTITNQGLSSITVAKGSNVTLDNVGKTGMCMGCAVNSDQTVTITLPDLASKLANGKKYSLAGWFKLTNQVTTGWIVKLGTNTCGLWWANSEARYVWNENDNGRRCANPTISSDFTNWHHLVTTVDKTVSGNITAKHYVDGLPAASYESQTWNNSGQSEPAGTTITLCPYCASMCDIRLYDHVLSELEIKELSKGIVVHYPLNRDGFGNDNLIPDSYQMDGANWTRGARTSLDTTEDGMGVSKLVGSSADWTSHVKTSQSATTKIPYSSIRNKTVTFSCWAKGSSNFNIPITFSLHTSSNVSRTKYYTPKTFGIGTSWKRYNFTVYVDDSKFTSGSGTISTTDYFFIELYNHTDGNTIYTKGWKLEIGDKVTPWIPCSSDALYTSMGLNNNPVSDVSGYQYNATAFNVTYSGDTARYGASSVFNGSGSYIRMDPTMYQKFRYARDELTASIWAYRDDWTSAPSATSSLFSCQESGGYTICITTSNKFYVVIGTGSSSNTYKTITSNASAGNLSAGWHMFTQVYDGLTLYLYIDGVLDKSSTLFTTKTPIYYQTGSTSMFIGAEAGSGSAYPHANQLWSGKLSDFRHYAVAFSAADILSLYNVSASLSNNGALLVNELVE